MGKESLSQSPGELETAPLFVRVVHGNTGDGRDLGKEHVFFVFSGTSQHEHSDA